MLKTIDLFAGAGGLSLGFEMTGKFQILAAAEINKNAQATYKKNLVNSKNNFVFIDNVLGYDFSALNNSLGGIDVVIGGPPCQGFSNANRQKNHLISMNNSLIKEFFRAIKEIKPKAFIMENVSMLRSNTHRFYESEKDYNEINQLIKNGFNIPKRKDTIYISNQLFENIDYTQIENENLEHFTIPAELLHLLSVLNKNISKQDRLIKYINNNGEKIIKQITTLLNSQQNIYDFLDESIINRLVVINESISKNNIVSKTQEISYIVNLQKMISTIKEIKSNKLIGHFSVDKNGFLIYNVNSYSVIDYINAILGGEYIQVGNTVNAKWFGVPQERKRYIVMGIKNDLYHNIEPQLPTKPEKLKNITVGDAIMDLSTYTAGYEKDFPEIPYNKNDTLSEYAKLMRAGCNSIKNHITTKSTVTAKERFKKIMQGKNFHSLSDEMKSTYSKPERTQNTIYLRLNPNEASGTVCNVRKSMWIHPTLNRAVTIREAARLQSFPDSFEFVGTKDSQFQQVGNAVPPLLAKGIADNLLKYLS
ncbi:DNA cytosine methyltransferase [Eubacterium sp. MSJ-33]|uniref:DNA cytosine methyltransferase n=1 Tax=Eubacterium sp. MSJ-33 TaxID=2841528 RepID=UPI001C795EC0|nr:DNA cytosine methyltransferase [Eubacterium sp. MSJ-33]QWT53575.1 DNA cytosine methyltransferase [Eubacterium sp. MSJ-33]